MQFAPLEDRSRSNSTDVTCWRCLHSLRELPGRFCPQCGAERGVGVAPQPPKPAKPPPWSGRFLKLPGVVYHGLLVMGCGAALLATALPGGVAPATAAAVGMLVLLGVIWFVRLASLGLVLCVIGGRHAPRGAIRRFAIAPLLITLAAVIVSADLPARAVFRLSRPALDRWVTRVMDGKRSAHRQRWIGFYPVRDVEFNADGVWFRTPWTLPNGGSGLVYSPHGRPADSRELTFRRRGGAWYEWTHDF